MEGIGRYGRFTIFADNMYFSDVPRLTCWYDEIVSSEAIVVVQCRLEILRCDATRRWGRVIVLIVEDDSR